MPTPTTSNPTSTDALWRRWRNDADTDARRELLGRYLGLVHHAAREVAPRVRDAVSLDELVSAGSLGLMQAMEGFDIDRGLAFSTFAMRRIRGAILDELRARDPLSRADRAHVRQLDGAVAQLEQRGGRAPTQVEVAQHLGVDTDTVHRWRRRTAIAGPISLEEEGSGPTIAEELSDDASDNMHGAVEIAERRRVIQAALERLPARERLVISRSYFEERPLREIANELGVTESRICQLRSQALARLKKTPQMAFANE